jgi:hypothetical protein
MVGPAVESSAFMAFVFRKHFITRKFSVEFFSYQVFAKQRNKKSVLDSTISGCGAVPGC